MTHPGPAVKCKSTLEWQPSVQLLSAVDLARSVVRRRCRIVAGLSVVNPFPVAAQALGLQGGCPRVDDVLNDTMRWALHPDGLDNDTLISSLSSKLHCPRRDFQQLSCRAVLLISVSLLVNRRLITVSAAPFVTIKFATPFYRRIDK